MRVVAQLKERFAILIAFAAFSLTYVFCQSLDNVSQFYVIANCIRWNVIVSAVYHAGNNFTCKRIFNSAN